MTKTPATDGLGSSPAGAVDATDGSQDGTRRLLEYCAAGRAARIDRDASVIRGVKVLGLDSKNGRTYSESALREAVSLYQGKQVNVDHIDGQRRSYRDRIGKLANIELRADGLYGDLLVNPKHPLAEQLFWDAQNSPDSVGLSHDVTGRTTARNGRIVVEAISDVRSVDLVAEPATTRSLYEGVDPSTSTQTDEPTKVTAGKDSHTNKKESINMDVEHLTIEQLKESRPDLVQQIAAATESDKQVIALKEERDRLAAELEGIRRKEKVASELAEAKLAGDKVPKSIMQSLLEADDERRKAIIADLATLLEASARPTEKPQSHRAGTDKLPESFEQRVASWA